MITTLREYRQRYPETSPEPTLTQNRMLGALLEQQNRVARFRARRRARFRAMAMSAQLLAARTLQAIQACGLL